MVSQKFKFLKNSNYLVRSQVHQNYMYIKNTCTLAILQISNEYRKILQDSERSNLAEITPVLELQKNLQMFQV